MRVALYVRVSSREQLLGYSIGEQEDRLKAYAKSRDYKVVKTYIDAAHSGADLDRPAIQELIKNIDRFDAVLVYKLNRLSRSQKDTLYLIEDVFIKNDVEFVSLSESLDTSTPFGRAMIGVLSAFAQLDREMITDQLTMGRIARAKDGYYHGGDPDKSPTGYDYIDGNLVINEYEADCIRYIYDEYLKGKGYGAIYQDIQTKYPGVIEDKSTVSKTLSRPLYKGYVTFKKKTHKGRHTPIIDEKTYDMVQKIRSKRRSRYSKKGTINLLTGIAKCGHCDAGMTGTTGKKRKDGTRMRYYACYTRRGPEHMRTQESCDKKYEQKEVVEDKIIKEIMKLKLSDIDKNNGSDDNRIANLKGELKKTENQISKMVDLFSLGNIPLEVLKDKIDNLNTKKESIKNRINELANDRADTDEIKELIPTLKDFNTWEEERQQLVIMKLINSIILYDDRIIIDWMF